MEWLSGWYNWPFLFLLAFGVLFITLDLVLGGLLGTLGVDSDVDLDADADPGIEAEGGHGPGAFLAWLGMGRVPLSIVLETLLITFGSLGLLTNAIWSEVNFLHWLSFPFALIIATLGSLICTRVLVDLLARLLPGDQTMTQPAGSWVGQWGMVINTVTATSGQIRCGTSFISVKRDPTAPPDDIPRDTMVVIMDYLEETNCYTVAPIKITEEEMSAP